jgi:small subunit ribosomal protein S14
MGITDLGGLSIGLAKIRHDAATIKNAVIFQHGLKTHSMAKKSMIERERKREKIVAKYAVKRTALKEAFDKAKDPLEKLEIHRKIQQLPRNSAKNRLHNRCWMTGRPHAVYRDFGLSRHVIREMAHEGLLPGVVKSSW